MHSMNSEYSSESDDSKPLISHKHDTPMDYLGMTDLKYSSDSDDSKPLISHKHDTPMDYLGMTDLKYSSDSDDSKPLISQKHATPMDYLGMMNCEYSSDSDDSKPLITQRDSQQTESISYESLLQPILEKCELCKAVFPTRFASIKHNVTHISVPLVHGCDECLFHFSSFQELSAHITDTNHNTSQLSVQHSKPKVRYKEILQSIVKKQVVVKCHDIFSGIFKDKIDSNNEKHSNEIDVDIPVRKPGPASRRIVKDKIDSNKEKHSNEIDVDIPIRKPGPASRRIVKKKSFDQGFIPTFVISSDSDSASDSREFNPLKQSNLKIKQKTDQDNSEPEQDNSEPEQDNSEPEQDNSEPEQDNSEPDYPETEQESDQSNPEWVQWNQEREDRSEMELGISKIKQGDPEMKKSLLKDEHKENSIYNFGIFENLNSRNSPLRQLSSPDYEPVQSRIIFEDDYEDDDLFETEDISPVKPYPETLTHQSSYIIGRHANVKKNSFIFGSQKMKSVNKPTNKVVKNDMLYNSVVTNGVIEECYAESVHYDELIVAVLCDCRYCGRCFCNRLELIKHEVIHIRLRRPRPAFCALCERYLAGSYSGLRKHLQTKHPRYEGRKLQVQKCKICNFNYYNYVRHVRYYHQLYECGTCNRCYDKEEVRTHDCTAPETSLDKFTDDSHSYKVLKMCDICLTLNKNRADIHYEVIGEHSEVGARQQCDRCHNKYFDVNLVKRKVASREGTETYKKKAPMSNKQRLKKMQNRLKMANKMNKR